MVSIVTRLVLVLTAMLPLALAAGGCPGSGPVYPKCEKDDQCKKDKAGADVNEYCLFGECQQCAQDAHCASGERCNRGRCEVSCATDDQCGAGQICEQSACVQAQCSESDPCAAGQRCTNGRCQTLRTTGPTPTSVKDLTSLSCSREQTVTFEYNASDLRPDAREALDTFAKCMNQNASWRLTVAGHADERGTTEYNLQLGERRAGSVRDYLARLGVDRARIRTISYGEERPVDSSGTESGWARNRRSELTVQE